MTPKFLSTVTVLVRPGVFDVVATFPTTTARQAYRIARSLARWYRRDPVFGYLVMFDVGRIVEGSRVEIAADHVRRAA